MGYINGKSAVRVGVGTVPDGSHRFSSTSAGRRLQSRSFSQSGPCILHFINCGFGEWRRKYRSLGNFADKWMGTTQIPFGFHLESRDILAAVDRECECAYLGACGASDRERERECECVCGADRSVSSSGSSDRRRRWKVLGSTPQALTRGEPEVIRLLCKKRQWPPSRCWC